jgi:hypothetical protein
MKPRGRPRKKPLEIEEVKEEKLESGSEGTVSDEEAGPSLK